MLTPERRELPSNKPPSGPNQLIRMSASDQNRQSSVGTTAGGETAGVSSKADLSSISFQDPETARVNLSRAVERLSPVLAGALPALLDESPEPDSALMLFDRLVSEASPEVVRLLDRHNSLAHYAIVVFGHSRFLGETLIQNTDLLHSFLRDKNLDRSFSRKEFHESLARFRSRSFETDVSLLLARFKRREYVRIMLRDRKSTRL